MLNNFLLVALLGLLAAPTLKTPMYRAVVIDGITSHPLASVTVQDVTGGTTCMTNRAGQFGLPLTATGVMTLHLSSIGYAPTDFSRVADNTYDTLRLAPATEALPGIVVRPGRQLELSLFTRPPHMGPSYYMIPSVQVAVHLPGLSEGQRGRINQLQMQLKPTQIRAGALRVSLRAPAADNTPTGTELLPAPLEVPIAQLVAAPKGLLTLDLSSYNVHLPATGVFVLIEGMGVTSDQQYVSISPAANGHSSLLVTGADPKDPHTYQVTRLEDYPILAAAETQDMARTWTMGSGPNGRTWRLHQPKDGKSRNKNSIVSLIVMAD